MASHEEEIIPIDRKATRAKVERMLSEVKWYRDFGEISEEATITASYELREGSSGGRVSKPTERLAVSNVDRTAYAKKFSGLLERLMSRMKQRERIIIERKYLDPEKIKDIDVAEEINLSVAQYSIVKSDAIYLIAQVLRLRVYMEPCRECNEYKTEAELNRGVCKKCTKEPGQ